MLFQRFQDGGLYLSVVDAANPSAARAAFLFQDASRTDSMFDVTASTWGVGLYVFFLPSATRDWTAFASAVRAIFAPSSGIQFAFVSEASGAASAVSTFITSAQAGSYVLQAPANFQTRNITVNVGANPVYPPVVAFDDLANQFTISNFATTNPAVVLTFYPAVTTVVTLQAVGQNLLLPLAGALTGCISQSFRMTESNLTSMEAGPLFFAPPLSQGAPLTALRYPMIRSLQEPSSSMNFTFWYDVLNAGDAERTYFQMMDAELGSYFASANGVTFTLQTNANGTPDEVSRFVLSNRPVQEVTESKFFYLAPAGKFGLSAGSGKSQSLLCGISGTEFMQVGLDGATVDLLQFVPNQPGYAPMTTGSATPLNASTQASWVKYGTTTGMYVSQPEQSPLYQQGTSAQISLGAEANSTAYLLDFLPLPSWQPAKDNATVAFTPTVPMVPYAGIPAAVDLTPFRAMETSALNPMRRNLMMASAQKSLEAGRALRATEAVVSSWAMTPQGLLAGLTADTPPVWTALRMALSPAPANFLQMSQLGTVMQTALKQNRIFLVNSTTGSSGDPLYVFTETQDQQVNISDWIFDLSPGDGAGNTSGNGDRSTQPLLIFKFYDGKSISALVDDLSLWSSAEELNSGGYSPTDAQSYLQLKIAEAKAAVEEDPDSIYANFYGMVTDPNFAGILGMNCALQLNDLPPAIQAVLGGMTRTEDGQTVSNVDQFRAHHLAIQINDTDPSQSTPAIAQSSFSALVDYEKPTDGGSVAAAAGDVEFLGFEVEYLRALFTNSELRTFSCQLNLIINNLFDTSVTLNPSSTAMQAADGNVVKIQGSYQNHSSGTTEGEGVYSFVAEGSFVFTFGTNDYLNKITLTKLQFSFAQSTDDSNGAPNGTTVTTISSAFSIWGSLAFKPTPVLDLFSFDSLSFADLGIDVSFQLTLDPPKLPVTSDLQVSFSPGNLRLDLGQTKPRGGDTSLMALLPFRLKSFLYSQTANQTLESLNYFSLGAVPGLSSVADTFNYALVFDLDLGSAGALVGSLEAFKFGFILGWLSGPDGGVAFGVQMPSADGKLEIKIQGVFDLIIEEFVLQYVDASSGGKMLVIGLLKSSVEILGKRIPPSGELNFALFKTIGGEEQVGWMVAWDNTAQPESGASRRLGHQHAALEADRRTAGHRLDAESGEDGGGEDDSSVFNVKYVGLGQRVGPDPAAPPTTFADFLSFMTKDFYDDFSKQDYNALYHPDAKWLIVVDIELLKVLEFGFIFYDVTPFYSLMLNVTDLFEFEITYTKVSDTIGLYYANLALPESLRTFQAGAASVMLPSLAVSVYTSGNWKVNLGFPNGDDWSGCFQVQAMAGPVPVTGAGGFYVASLSSATDKIFVATYPSILAFGLAVRLGVGKDFTSGPLSAGVSITFFGIIEGAVGYLASGSVAIFSTPDALMLSGQFGLIGQIYGSIDFKIISASVNVTLSASIGVVLKLEQGIGGNILLYVEASVSLSVSVSINLGFFSISISFSFNATFRFQWMLLASGQQVTVAQLAFASRRLQVTGVPGVLPLCPGFVPVMPLWFLPELTVVFPDATNPGLPYFAMGLAVQFDPAPAASPKYSDFKPFEALTTQLTTWALMNAFQLPAYNSTIEQTQLSDIDQTPDLLVGFLTYELLLEQLAVFAQTTITVPSSETPTEVSAATFPMPPFLQLATLGRLNGSNQPSDLSYTFGGQNLVSSSYLQEVEEYFNQLFLNSLQSQSPDAPTALADTTVAFAQQVFLEYFSGLIRSGVHALLQTMEDAKMDSAPLDQVFCAAVGATSFAALGGQMSSMFRGGARLPYTAGLTIPDGTVNESTNPLYSLLWQQFPVGTISTTSKQYLVNLTQPDTTQTWITANVSYALTTAQVSPYTGLTAAAVAMPSAPTLIPYTSAGPQSFSFANATKWTQDAATSNLYAFPSSMLSVTGAQSGATNVLIESRSAGQAYLDDVTELPSSSYAFATTVQITAKQIPADGDGTKTQTFLPNVYAISGASQSEQALLAAILAIPIGSSPVTSIQVLYQTAAGSAGLTSTAVNAADVFLLRTNTTTVSAPPPQARMAEFQAMPAPTVAVGATVAEFTGFLQILKEAAVTNAPGYYLHYKSKAGKDLPADLFTAGPAPLTILITFEATTGSPVPVQPYYNALEIFQPDASLVYYAQTVDTTLDLQYAAVAPGAVGAELVRTLSATMLTGADGTKHTRRGFVAAAARAGIADEQALHEAMAAAGAAPAQLNSLYSLVTYQVEATAGVFIESNLSAPLQPQAATDAKDTDPRTYRAFVPLYTLATANQSLPVGTTQNRYASIGGSYTVDFFLNDCFGNQMPGELSFTGKNLYFDTLLALDTWTGVVSSFSFADAKANTVDVALTPGDAAFSGMSADQAKSVLSNYQTIGTQINGPGVSFYVASSLSLEPDGTPVSVTVNAGATAAVQQMVTGIVAYLTALVTHLETPGSNPPAWTVQPVKFAVVLPATTSPLPAAFALSVSFGIERDVALLAPSLIGPGGVILFPSAQHVSTNVAPDPTAQSALATFAANFVACFPTLSLAVGLGGAQDTPKTKSAKQRKALRSLGVAADPAVSTGSSATSALWAVATTLTQIAIANPQTQQPLYLSPKPLLNALESGTVAMPTVPGQTQLPATQSFVDVDLDVVNSSFFAAVDQVLTPATAAAIFQVNPAAYTTLALGREGLATGYSNNELGWLFDGTTFTGTHDDLTEAISFFEQGCRASLMTAYTVDTLLQFGVAWTGALPAGAAGNLSLYGRAQPVPASKQPIDPSQNTAFSCSQIEIPETGGDGLLTVAYSSPNITGEAQVVLPLQFTLTHLQVFTVPESEVPADQARPSLWLQLVNPVTIAFGDPAGTVIPVVYRQYPTPPTLINQSGVAATNIGNGSNPLTQAAQWVYSVRYQAQLTAHDQLGAYITWNSVVASNAERLQQQALRGETVIYTLFQSLCRFNAAYPILEPMLRDPAGQNFSAAASTFAQLVTDVVNNSDWNPVPQAQLAGGTLEAVSDPYVIDDQALEAANSRQITLTWTGKESSMPNASVSIVGAAPDGTVYPGQTSSSIPNGIQDDYTANPPIVDDWVSHLLTVEGIDVLTAENARAGIQVERNLITLRGENVNAEYVYMTPFVEATQPVTPFLDNQSAINMTMLPSVTPGAACTSTNPANLCQRINTLLMNLLTISMPSGIGSVGDPATYHRLKMSCSFSYPLTSAADMPAAANPLTPLIPVILARSFDIADSLMAAQVGAFCTQFATAIGVWTTNNDITFGAGSVPSGGQLIFDVTLFAQLSGNSRPLLRLRNLQLALTDIEAAAT